MLIIYSVQCRTLVDGLVVMVVMVLEEETKPSAMAQDISMVRSVSYEGESADGRPSLLKAARSLIRPGSCLECHWKSGGRCRSFELEWE